MKILFTIFLVGWFVMTLRAQSFIKPPSAGVHYTLTDFETAEKIKATSLGNVLKNKLWSKPPQMMTGFGVDFLTGITKHIDFVASLNYTKGIDVFNLPSTNLNNYSLFTTDALLNIKFFSDRYYVRPLIIAGVGMYNQNGTGAYAPLGAGLQFNIFDAAIVNAQMQYRVPFKNIDNPCLIYQVGFATSLRKRKTQPKPIPPVQAPAVEEAKPVATIQEVKPVLKSVVVMVKDEATSLPLQYANVTLTDSSGNVTTLVTQADGRTVFDNMQAGSYTISGALNGINTSAVTLNKENFDSTANQITITLTHNDPRFTLVGHTVDKTTGNPVGNTIVTVTNTTQNSVDTAGTDKTRGEFRVQLAANSSFTIVGKKANYISNIEAISTRGLKRSITLYVNLELAVQEAKAGEAIVLNNIYFKTGKATLQTASSGDLDKLVQFLNDNPAKRLEISGYTDNVGSLEKNKALSQQRANSVVAYLIKNGVSPDRLLAKGYGPLQPIADNTSPDGRAKNRRVEMKVVQ